MRGKFIVFEGIDGSGKSTQIRLSAQRLAGRGVCVHTTKEPSDGVYGKQLRRCLSGKLEVDEREIALLFARDRLDHIQNKTDGLLKILDSGCNVLCDRYYFSSYAYHGVHLDMDWVIQINAECAAALTPDLTIYIDIDPRRSLERVLRRGELERYEKLDNMIKVREKYQEAFQKLKQEKVAIINGNTTIKSVQNEIATRLDDLVF